MNTFRNRANIIISSLLLTASSLFGKTLEGRVFSISESGDTLSVIGASVVLKNTRLGSATNLEGIFKLTNIPDNLTTLDVSCIGYEPVSLFIDSSEQLLIKLNASINTLDDIVVMGSSKPIENNSGSGELLLNSLSDVYAEPGVKKTNLANVTPQKNGYDLPITRGGRVQTVGSLGGINSNINGSTSNVSFQDVSVENPSHIGSVIVEPAFYDGDKPLYLIEGSPPKYVLTYARPIGNLQSLLLSTTQTNYMLLEDLIDVHDGTILPSINEFEVLLQRHKFNIPFSRVPIIDLNDVTGTLQLNFQHAYENSIITGLDNDNYNYFDYSLIRDFGLVRFVTPKTISTIGVSRFRPRVGLSGKMDSLDVNIYDFKLSYDDRYYLEHELGILDSDLITLPIDANLSRLNFSSSDILFASYKEKTPDYSYGGVFELHRTYQTQINRTPVLNQDYFDDISLKDITSKENFNSLITNPNYYITNVVEDNDGRSAYRLGLYGLRNFVITDDISSNIGLRYDLLGNEDVDDRSFLFTLGLDYFWDNNSKSFVNMSHMADFTLSGLVETFDTSSNIRPRNNFSKSTTVKVGNTFFSRFSYLTLSLAHTDFDDYFLNGHFNNGYLNSFEGVSEQTILDGDSQKLFFKETISISETRIGGERLPSHNDLLVSVDMNYRFNGWHSNIGLFLESGNPYKSLRMENDAWVKSKTYDESLPPHTQVNFNLGREQMIFNDWSLDLSLTVADILALMGKPQVLGYYVDRNDELNKIEGFGFVSIGFTIKH